MISDKIIRFLKTLDFKEKLPEGISLMNPYREANSSVFSGLFYKKYYNDQNKRILILGINPGRFGAGVTGIPFTDTKRLVSVCGLPFNGAVTHEPSSVFVYEVIEKYGGTEAFYSNFYIGAVCPLGFTLTTQSGKEINYNYYDSKELFTASYKFIIDNLKKQIDLGMKTEQCFCLGTGKNFKHLLEINNKYKFFNEIHPLEHPRYIMQYKQKMKAQFVDKFISSLSKF